MLFLGEHTLKADCKGRLSLPAAFKGALEAAGALNKPLILKRDALNTCLKLTTSEVWQREFEIIRGKLNPYQREHDQFLRAWLMGTFQVEPDGMGRILIPKSLMEAAKLNKDITMLGKVDHIEIWDAELLRQQCIDADTMSNKTIELLGGATAQLPQPPAN